MNTISKETVAMLARVHELRRIELEAEGFTAKICPALGSHRMARLTFRNGSEHTLVLPLAKVVAWSRLCQGEIGIEFEEQAVKLFEGAGQVRLLSKPLEDDLSPHFTLDAGDSHNGQFRLVGQEDIFNKLQAAKSVHREQKHLARIAKLRGVERQALKDLRQAAKEHCERVTFLASMTLADAVTEAREFLKARRFVRRTLAALESKPDWLLTSCPPKESAEWIHQYHPEITESQDYDQKLAGYLEAKRKLESYKPKKSWSKHAARETEKRTHEMNKRKWTLEGVLKSALARHLGGACHKFGERKPGDAAYGWHHGAYHRERQFVRAWCEDKRRLANDYTTARQLRIDAMSKPCAS